MASASPFVFFFLGAFLVVGCSKSPTMPGQTAVPKITCPAPASVVSSNNLSALVTYASPTVSGGQIPLTTTCSPASGAPFPIGSNTVTCTTTDSLRRTDSCTFSIVVTVSPQISLTRFAAFGDSITWGEDGSIPGECSADVPSSIWQLQSIGPRVQLPLASQYPSQLQTTLRSRYIAQASSITVDNKGTPGQTAANAFCCDPVTSFTAEVLSGGGYQAVLIMEGANDLPNDSAAIDGLRQMVEGARNAGIRPYLATITPEEVAQAACERGGNAVLVPGLNDQIKSLAASEGVTLVDVYQGFPSGDLIALGLLGHDGLHPTPSGYSIIAQTFFQSLKSTLETH